MYKKLISSKHEDLVLYIQCNCGAEILKIYYYRPTTTCSEIIMIDYIGNIERKNLVKYKYIDLQQSSFYDMINALKRCEKEGPFTYEIKEGERHLHISKQGEFTKMELFQNSKFKKLVLIWDIMIHNDELFEINNELLEMKNQYEVINNVKRSNQ